MYVSVTWALLISKSTRGLSRWLTIGREPKGVRWYLATAYAFSLFWVTRKDESLKVFICGKSYIMFIGLHNLWLSVTIFVQTRHLSITSLMAGRPSGRAPMATADFSRHLRRHFMLITPHPTRLVMFLADANSWSLPVEPHRVVGTVGGWSLITEVSVSKHNNCPCCTSSLATIGPESKELLHEKHSVKCWLLWGNPKCV